MHRGEITVGTVAAFVLYLGNVFEPIQQLSQLFNTLQSAGAALSKLFGLLDTKATVVERVAAVDLPARGDIVATGVGFDYDGVTPVLDDVNLVIAPGRAVRLGRSDGCGQVDARQTRGPPVRPDRSVRSPIGGRPARRPLVSLRQRIVVVPQEGFLFNGTIRDNVRIGRADATDADVEDALRIIGVYDHFARFPDGLATEVRERGSRLSAGERQLVSLARAALANPEVLVLDEATSSLDPGTEAEIESAMDALMQGRTVVVIAHRLSTAARADRVGVVDGGRLLELGTHDELVAAGRGYAALFDAWAGSYAS